MDMDDGRRTEALEQVESEASSTSQQERLPGEGVNTAGPEGEQGVGGQVGTTVRTPPDEAVGEPIGTTVRTATEEVDGEQIGTTFRTSEDAALAASGDDHDATTRDGDGASRPAG